MGGVLLRSAQAPQRLLICEFSDGPVSGLAGDLIGDGLQSLEVGHVEW